MGERKNIKLVLQYDGSRYQGWQRQKAGLTIQGLLEERIRGITGEPASLIASGRTDAGVHALHQVCHFLTSTGIEPEALRRGLNSLIPEDIHILRADRVPLPFHARYSARAKTYEYRILNRKERDVFLRDYTWHVPVELDLEEMRRCLAALTGRHDFSSFRSSGSENKDPVREMMRSELSGPQEKVIHLFFEADGFLRHMVRNIVGTIVDVGRGRVSYDEFLGILHAKDRRLAGIKAPSQGLYLIWVSY